MTLGMEKESGYVTDQVTTGRNRSGEESSPCQ